MLGYRWWFSRHQLHAVGYLLRSTGVMEMNRSISISTEFWSLAAGSADTRNWFRQASSTDDEYGCASSTHWRFAGGPVCSSASRSSLPAASAAVVHSSNSHCLANTSVGAPNSRPGYHGSTTVATTYRHSSVTALNRFCVIYTQTCTAV